MKTLLKNVTITINVLLKTNLGEISLICLSMYGNSRRNIFTTLSIRILLSQKNVCGSRKCNLCICEKLDIARADPNVILKN